LTWTLKDVWRREDLTRKEEQTEKTYLKPLAIPAIASVTFAGSEYSGKEMKQIISLSRITIAREGLELRNSARVVQMTARFTAGNS
jgi:hypothetical protein